VHVRFHRWDAKTVNCKEYWQGCTPDAN